MVIMKVTATVLLVLCLLAARSHAWDCQELPIKGLVQIDAGIGDVVGTDTGGIPNYLAGEWLHLPGNLKHITVGPAGMYGVNGANDIFKFVAGNWKQVAGSLKQIDAGGDAFIVGTNFLDVPYCLKQVDTVNYQGPGSPLQWTELPGRVKYFSCGPFGCWGVNSNDDIFLINVKPDCQHNDWINIAGKLSMIEVATDGSVFGANAGGDVFTRDGITASKPEGTGWTQIKMSMSIKHVSYNLGRLWAISKSGVTLVCKGQCICQ